MHSIYASSQKVLDVETIKQSSSFYIRSQKVNDTKIILSKVINLSRVVDVIKTCIDCIIKLFAKAKVARSILGQKSIHVKQSSEIKDFVV